MTAETMYPVPAWPETPRVYVDTSVFSACEDEKYWIRESSRTLFERFRTGDMTLVLSAAVAAELESASEAARALPGTVPREHSDYLGPSGAAEELADLYIEAGAVDAATRSVALHVAFATLANVDTLASWNYKHLLNLHRRPRFQRRQPRTRSPPHRVVRAPGDPRRGLSRHERQELRLRRLHARAEGPHQSESWRP